MQAHWEHHLLALAAPSADPTDFPVPSRAADEALLPAAYDLCDTITAHNSKSFFMASGLLPAAKRRAVRALYAFCRTVDDIVDNSSASDRYSRLEHWRRTCAGVPAAQHEPVAAAWADTLHRHRIPRRYALQLIDGVARDLEHVRYASFNDLSTYCYGVASTVGLMSMHIVGFGSAEAIPYAIKLGVALQMTNILRDVGEDFRRGRIYLPQDELRAFGLCEADLASGLVTDAWRAFMRFQIDRARQLYAESWPGIKMLARDAQFSIAAASSLYGGILDEIQKSNYDVFSRRASLSTSAKLGRLPSLFLKVYLSPG